MKNKLLYIFSVVIILTAIVLILICGWLAFVPVTVIQPNVQPYKVLTKNIEQGGTLIYEVDICKFREAPTTIVRRFVDTQGVIYALPTQESNLEKGCQKIGVPIATPSTLHAGDWYLTLDIAYKVNPLRTENYHLRTETFTINK